MKDDHEFTFCPMRLNLKAERRLAILSEVLGVENRMWYHDSFRGCWMLPVFNGGGRLGPSRNHDLTFQWTEGADHCPQLRAFLQEQIFPSLKPLGRVTILRTKAQRSLNTHIDCAKAEVGTRQHKMRLVLNGDIDRLFFLNNKGEPEYVPSVHGAYVIDGSHPHGLQSSPLEKVTICIGAPWNGFDDGAQLLDFSQALSISRPLEIQDTWQNPLLREN